MAQFEDGLACFVAPDFFRSYRLPLTFASTVMVARSFFVGLQADDTCGT